MGDSPERDVAKGDPGEARNLDLGFSLSQLILHFIDGIHQYAQLIVSPMLEGLLEIAELLGIRTLGELVHACSARGRPNFAKIALADVPITPAADAVTKVRIARLITKQRHGSTGRVRLRFESRITRPKE